MKQWIAELLDAHAWKILGSAITIIGTITGGAVTYGVHLGKQEATQQVIQQEAAAYQAAQDELKNDLASVKQDVSKVKQDVSEVRGTTATILTLLRGRK